jgi:hypothetical protein
MYLSVIWLFSALDLAFWKWMASRRGDCSDRLTVEWEFLKYLRPVKRYTQWATAAFASRVRPVYEGAYR